MSKFEGNENMIRIIAVAAAFLVMCIIIGISVYSIDRIDKSNQKVKDIEEGKQFAATIIQTEQTTNIWDYLRNTTTVETEVTELESIETLESAEMPESDDVVVETQEGEEGISSDTTLPETTEPEQTTAVTTQVSSTGYILYLD